MGKGRWRSQKAGNKGRTGCNQAHGGRKRARSEIDTNSASLEARRVLNWLWHVKLRKVVKSMGTATTFVTDCSEHGGNVFVRWLSDANGRRTVARFTPPPLPRGLRGAETHGVPGCAHERGPVLRLGSSAWQIYGCIL